MDAQQRVSEQTVSITRFDASADDPSKREDGDDAGEAPGESTTA